MHMQFHLKLIFVLLQNILQDELETTGRNEIGGRT